MSFAQNLKTLRKLNSLTQQDLADRAGISRAMVGAYEEGRAKPRMETLKTLANIFSISVDTILYKTIDQSLTSAIESKSLKGDFPDILTVTVDKQGAEEIVLIPQKAAAGYLRGYADPEWMAEMPVLSLPYLKPGTYRAFEIQGDSMLPVLQGSVVVAELVRKPEEIKKGQSYIILSVQDGVVFKRFMDWSPSRDRVVLSSDNPSYPALSIPVEELVEIWQTRAIIQFGHPRPSHSGGDNGLWMQSVEERLNKLEAR